MTNSDATILDLMSKVYEKGTHERRALLLEIIDLADAQNDLDNAFTARARYVTACHGESDQLHMISNYGWCLARHDEDPDRFPISLWEYKWVVGAANDFSGISRAQLMELVDDMARRFEAVGGSKGPAGVARCEAAASLGDLDELPALLQLWKDTPKRGRLNDCATCDITTEVFLLTELDRHEDAIIAADPVINGGRRCATQPHYAYADLLRSARAVGDTELAQMLSVVGLDLLKNDPDFTAAFGNHLRHFAVTGQLDEAMALLRRTEPIIVGSEANLLAYYRGARLALRLADTHGVDNLGDLHERFDGQAERLAAKFDERNGNTVTSGRVIADDAEFSAAH